MARTVITPTVPKGPFPGTVAANALDVTFIAADSVNKNQFSCGGRDLILVTNVHASAAKTFTLTSAPDPQKRSGDISAYSLAAGEYAAFWVGSLIGWDQGSSVFHLEGEDNNIKFCVLQLPG